jgi:hypothetical protein
MVLSLVHRSLATRPFVDSSGLTEGAASPATGASPRRIRVRCPRSSSRPHPIGARSWPPPRSAQILRRRQLTAHDVSGIVPVATPRAASSAGYPSGFRRRGRLHLPRRPACTLAGSAPPGRLASTRSPSAALPGRQNGHGNGTTTIASLSCPPCRGIRQPHQGTRRQDRSMQALIHWYIDWARGNRSGLRILIDRVSCHARRGVLRHRALIQEHQHRRPVVGRPPRR